MISKFKLFLESTDWIHKRSSEIEIEIGKKYIFCALHYPRYENVETVGYPETEDDDKDGLPNEGEIVEIINIDGEEISVKNENNEIFNDVGVYNLFDIRVPDAVSVEYGSGWVKSGIFEEIEVFTNKNGYKNHELLKNMQFLLSEDLPESVIIANFNFPQDKRENYRINNIILCDVTQFEKKWSGQKVINNNRDISIILENKNIEHLIQGSKFGI